MIDRRILMKGAGLMAVAAGMATRQSSAAQEVPFSSGTDAPKLQAPAIACDCHMHIYDSRFPVAPNATLKPPDAHVEDYRLLQQRIGTTRNVVVTPGTSKFTVTWDASTESDLSGYRIYYGSASGAPYGTVVDAVDVGPVDVPVTTNGTYYVTVTAYDLDYNDMVEDGTKPLGVNQVLGHESWYAPEKTVTTTP